MTIIAQIRIHVFGIGQPEMADILGVPPSELSNWEAGEAEPGLSHLQIMRAEAIARRLEWSDEWLFIGPPARNLHAPIEGPLIGHLQDLLKTYAEATGEPVTSVARAAARDGSYFANLGGERSTTLRRFDEVRQWFADHWPASVEWPALRIDQGLQSAETESFASTTAGRFPSVADVIATIGASNLSSHLQLPSSTVGNWKGRNSIPPEYWVEVIREARVCGAEGVTADLLATLHARSAIEQVSAIANSENRIREIRQARGMTLEDLSEQTGLSVSYLSRMESQKRNVSLHNLQTIAIALGVSVRALIPEGDIEIGQQ
jgi:transcriptional regulator with XRE-family HTH domain